VKYYLVPPVVPDGGRSRDSGFYLLPLLSWLVDLLTCNVLTYINFQSEDLIDGSKIENNLEPFRFEFRIETWMVRFSTFSSTFVMSFMDASRSVDFISNFNE
jgi:hypothetical protein